jgi:endogenous inhibitor of DNA gyrase (YacG/DUF329 family)
MVSNRKCPYCERQVRLRKDSSGLRVKHYVLVEKWFSRGFAVCRGSDPYGAKPSWSEIEEGRKPTLACPYCGKRVKKTADFRMYKHADNRGRDCQGWIDSQNVA